MQWQLCSRHTFVAWSTGVVYMLPLSKQIQWVLFSHLYFVKFQVICTRYMTQVVIIFPMWSEIIVMSINHAEGAKLDTVKLFQNGVGITLYETQKFSPYYSRWCLGSAVGQKFHVLSLKAVTDWGDRQPLSVYIQHCPPGSSLAVVTGSTNQLWARSTFWKQDWQQTLGERSSRPPQKFFTTRVIKCIYANRCGIPLQVILWPVTHL